MEQKLIKYKDKWLTLKNYKEPLIEIEESNGVGYYGVLLSSTDGEFVQCHICGELYKDVGKHAEQKHKIPVKDYKNRFGLAYSTALISETERFRRKNQTLAWLKTLTKEQIKEYRVEAREQRKFVKREKQPKLQLETYNKRGTCPDQLLAKIKEVADKLGYTPSLKEFVWETGGQRYKHLIFKVYGSWKNALKMANLREKEPQKGGYRQYNDEELLEYLKIFQQENHQIPTSTDCNRGLLPSESVYRTHFGSLPKARILAEIE